jgi:hypothetical protein
VACNFWLAKMSAGPPPKHEMFPCQFALGVLPMHENPHRAASKRATHLRLVTGIMSGYSARGWPPFWKFVIDQLVKGYTCISLFKTLPVGKGKIVLGNMTSKYLEFFSHRLIYFSHVDNDQCCCVAIWFLNNQRFWFF